MAAPDATHPTHPIHPTDPSLAGAARGYLAAGLCVLPAIRSGESKRPLISWKPYQDRLPTGAELADWMATSPPALCIVCGAVSGHLEMIDFDLGGELYEAWLAKVEADAPGLAERLVVEATPSGGRHVVYRCQSPVCGNLKLAQRRVHADGPDELLIGGKAMRPRRDAQGSWHADVTLIETRGEGGLFLCSPSPGYAIVRGDLAYPPVLMGDERDLLLRCAWELSELAPPIHNGPSPIPSPTPAPTSFSTSPSAEEDIDRPGDGFNRRGDVRDILRRNGWQLARSGENEHWRRPGKGAGTSATLKDGVFYVFSSNAPPFEPHVGYSPFAVLCMLEHAGDWSAAASALRERGYGGKPVDETRGVDLSAFLPAGDSGAEPAAPPTAPPEPMAPAFIWAADLSDRYPVLRPPVIGGLLREGETMNVIAAPKTGKSWLTLDLAVAVATGRPWLGLYPTVQGKVLIIDNELHRETSADRLPRVIRARGLDPRSVGREIAIDNLRGRLADIFGLAPYFDRLERGMFKVIILDAFYRFMPRGGDENDNGMMANIYNAIDAYADRLGCCFVLIHHSTKGNQSGKAVTDVGAGAGSQSRATDTHLVLRPHEEDGCVVLDAAVRSWPPIDPAGLRWTFPLWDVDDTLDPGQLRSDRPKRKAKEEKPEEPDWDPERFVLSFVGLEPRTKAEIRELTSGEPGLTWRRVGSLLDLAEHEGLIERRRLPGRGGRVGYAIRRPDRQRALDLPEEASDA